MKRCFKIFLLILSGILFSQALCTGVQINCEPFFSKLGQQERNILQRTSKGTIDRYNGVCRMVRAQGFDIEYMKAMLIFKKIGVKDTLQRNETVIIIQRYDEGFYCHSNFKISDDSDIYPAKVCGDLRSLKMILANIFFSEYPNEKEYDLLMDAYENHVLFIIFDNVLDSRSSKLEVAGLKTFYIVSSEGQMIKVLKSDEKADGTEFSMNISIEQSINEENSRDCIETYFGDFGSVADDLIKIISCGFDFWE